AEGWVTQDNKRGSYAVCLANNNQDLLEEMQKLLKGFGYQVYRRKNVIRVRDYQLFCYLKQFGKCSDKFIPKEIKSLSKKYLEILLRYYLKGDGHIHGRTQKGLSATTSSIHLRDDLQEIALKIGISAYYKMHSKKGSPFRSPCTGKIYSQRGDVWVVYFIRQNNHTIMPSTIKKFNYTESWVDYKGKVYCISVPNRVIYVRRNGIPVWCGNSDPPMNWRLSKLDKFSLVSNSDSHSPQRIGREANVFDCEVNYWEIKRVLEAKDKDKFLYTVEFFPQEGKYHYDGHRNCKVRLHPKETKKHGGICPVCGRPLTRGVLNRVEELADREEGFVPQNSIGYKSLVPLSEIIAEARGMDRSSKAVEKEYVKLVREFGSEFNLLVNVEENQLFSQLPPKIAEGIKKVREGKLNILPGFDGEYGVIKIFDQTEDKSKDAQLTLF
ncbi:MAG: hypothetical protein DRP81_03180, partial [Candidatus Omnitrophota bacterium]